MDKCWIGELIHDCVNWGSRVALKDERTEVRYNELIEYIRGMDGFLRGKRPESNFKFATILTNRVEYPLLYLTGFYFGYPIVPISYNYPPSLINYILNDAQVNVVVVDSSTIRMVRGFESKYTIKNIEDFLFSKKTPGGEYNFEGTFLIGSINYTSGTTGRPKGVMISHKNYIAGCNNFVKNTGEFEHGKSVLHVLPFSHSTVALLLPSLKNGMTTFIHQCRGTAEVIDAARMCRPEIIALYPSIIYEIVDIVKDNPSLKHHLSCVKTVFYGSAPINPGRLKEAIDVFGQIFIQLYGMTETLPPVAILSKKDHCEAMNGRYEILASCGRVIKEVQVRIVDREGGDVVEGDVGEIIVRGDNVTAGYYNNAEATRKLLRQGWAHTGDLGYFRNGFLFLVDRKNDVIIRRGQNIYPLEVENAIYSIKGIKECCVFSAPDEKDGEVPYCALSIEKDFEFNERKVRRALCEYLPENKIPVKFILMDFIPRNVNGKVDRKSLREKFWKGLTRRIN